MPWRKWTGSLIMNKKGGTDYIGLSGEASLRHYSRWGLIDEKDPCTQTGGRRVYQEQAFSHIVVVTVHQELFALCALNVQLYLTPFCRWKKRQRGKVIVEGHRASQQGSKDSNSGTSVPEPVCSVLCPLPMVKRLAYLGNSVKDAMGQESVSKNGWRGITEYVTRE